MEPYAGKSYLLVLYVSVESNRRNIEMTEIGCEQILMISSLLYIVHTSQFNLDFVRAIFDI